MLLIFRLTPSTTSLLSFTDFLATNMLSLSTDDSGWSLYWGKEARSTWRWFTVTLSCFLSSGRGHNSEYFRQCLCFQGTLSDFPCLSKLSLTYVPCILMALGWQAFMKKFEMRSLNSLLRWHLLKMLLNVSPHRSAVLKKNMYCLSPCIFTAVFGSAVLHHFIFPPSPQPIYLILIRYLICRNDFLFTLACMSNYPCLILFLTQFPLFVGWKGNRGFRISYWKGHSFMGR